VPQAAELADLAIDQLETVRARLEAGLPIEAQCEIVCLVVGRIAIHRESDIDGVKSVRAVVEYRSPGAVLVDTDNGSSPRRVRQAIDNGA
jgi:hypothetical protein